MELDVGKLLIVARVGRLGSITAAAEMLHLTPSAISQQIRRLERGLGLPLFERRPHGMVLTEAGALITKRTGEIESRLTSLGAELERLTSGLAGRVSFGVFPTFASSLLPMVMKTFRSSCAGIELDVRSMRLKGLREQVLNQELDLAITWSYPWEREVLPSMAVGLDPNVVLLPPGHPEADAEVVPLGRLAEENWVCRADGHAVTDLLHRASAAAGFEPRIVVAANDYQETQAMVAAGIGIAMVPRLSTMTRRPDIAVRSVSDEAPPRTLHLIRRPTATPSRAIDQLVQVVEEMVNSKALAPTGSADSSNMVGHWSRTCPSPMRGACGLGQTAATRR
ncbi:LysR family transcriptional regulator [Arthrobacter sp. SD76]|uniref:LysR family transcriptional regulator n=1 Tax=Arthrobacter sp. SD76 TaxID=3415007 RepID=UPI003C724C5B